MVLLPDSESEMEIMSDDDDESDPLWNPTPGASFTYATLQPVQPVDDPTEDLPLSMLNYFEIFTGVDDQFDAGEATTFPTTEAQPSPIQSTSSSPISSSTVPNASMKNQDATKEYKWLRKEIEPRDITWKASLPKATEIHLPIDLFRTFITDSIVAGLVDQTNLHATRKTNARIALKLTQHEMNRFLGVQMLMSIVKLPATKMYWECIFQ